MVFPASKIEISFQMLMFYLGNIENWKHRYRFNHVFLNIVALKCLKTATKSEHWKHRYRSNQQFLNILALKCLKTAG